MCKEAEQDVTCGIEEYASRDWTIYTKLTAGAFSASFTPFPSAGQTGALTSGRYDQLRQGYAAPPPYMAHCNYLPIGSASQNV